MSLSVRGDIADSGLPLLQEPLQGSLHGQPGVEDLRHSLRRWRRRRLLLVLLCHRVVHLPPGHGYDRSCLRGESN